MGMLVIGKPSEFDENDLAVRGQCQPHARGWRLRFVEKGQESLLHVDSYYVCRQIQQQNRGVTLDEARQAIRAFLEEMGSSMEETQRLPGPRIGAAAGDPEATTAFHGVDRLGTGVPEAENPMRPRRKDFET